MVYSQRAPRATPKQVTLRRELERRIAAMSAGEPLPAERDLAGDLGVARMTLRRTLDALVAEHWLVRRHGAGTFVAPRRLDQRLRATSFSQDMRDRGMVPGSHTLRSGVVPATAELALALATSPGDEVLHVRRLRTADGAPMAVEDLHVPAEVVPGLAGEDLEDSSFYDLLAERFGLHIAGGVQSAQPCLVDPDDAECLGVEPGVPAFLFERTSRLDDGRVVEFVRSVYPGDRYRIVADIYPDASGAPGAREGLR